jgi:hypothetical protein
MTALKKTIPTLIEDEKERKKVLRETDKLIFDLGQAERQELKGNWDKAGEEKSKLAERGIKLNEIIGRHVDARAQNETQLAGQAMSANASVKGHEISAAASKYAADLRYKADLAQAAASRANAEAARDATDYNKALGAYQIANDSLAKVQAAIDNAKKTGPYADAQNEIRRLSVFKDPDERVKGLLAAAQSVVNNADTEYAKRIKDSEKMVAVAEARVKANDKGAAVLTGANDMSPQNKEALKWANEHPNDPRAAQIKAQLGK